MASNSYGVPDDDGDEMTGEVRMPDDGGGAVTPQSATPSMAKGGAIPDEDEELGSNAGVEDNTTTQLNGALQKVQQALMYGRQQNGLPGGGGSSGETAPQEEAPQEGIPDDNESYAAGGAIGEDIEASNSAADDGPQYGRPEVVDDPDAVRPPISSNNTDYGDVPEQTAIPQQAPGGDESGAMPATPPVNDESGAAPTVAGGLPTDDYTQPAYDAMGNAQPGSGPQQIVGYLQGKGAMPNDQALEIERSVHAEAKNDPAAVSVLAAAKAGEMDGPAAAFAYIQRNRQAYDATMAHARAAATGVQGKPADLNAAAESATKANAYLPDGVNAKFLAEPGGIRAVVAGNGKGQQEYRLSPQQFVQFVDTTKDGQFDRVLAAGGAGGVLKQIVGSAGGAGAQQPEQQPRLGDEAANRANQTTGRPVNMGRDMTLLRSSAYDQANPAEARASQAGRGGSLGLSGKPVRVIGQGGPDGTNERTFIDGVDQTPTAQDNALERIRAKNEGRGSIEDKLKLEDRKGENRLAVEGARGKNRLDAVNERGKYYTQHENALDARSAANRESREKMAANKLVESAKSREATNGRNAASNAERLIAAKTLAGQKLTPQEQAVSDRVIQGGGQQQAPQPQAPQAPQPQTPQLTKAQIGEMLRKRGLLQ